MNFKRLFILVLATASLSVFFGCIEDEENIISFDEVNDSVLNSGTEGHKDEFID